MTKLSLEQQKRELSIGSNQLHHTIGRKPTWYRPPFGLYNDDTMQAAEELGMQVMLWRVASWDWMHAKNPDQIIQNVLDFAEPGDVILLHELPQTARILPELIQELRHKGFLLKKLTQPVTI